ncbi:hypothetical protein M9H77_22424 [Catharanthus roseus]|uniref:Uncharacterized protein n=2 Tax=Catharanthus roseus TaxID=4058 RepID=A0ACC0AQF3_CATRO|nr:hypothetical protein M9H77_22423 [Catharanthus roseus]KAI5663101.1 hypothetical protein M9H77_22424 [Catharanthus roseus]
MYEVTQNIDISSKVDDLSKKRDEGKLPSHPIENPRANYHEQAKTIITLRNRKLVDNKVGEPIKDDKFNENETEGIDMRTEIERKIETELTSYSNSKTLESSPTKGMKCLFCRIIRQHFIIMEITEMVYYSSEHALILPFLPGCVVLFFVSSILLTFFYHIVDNVMMMDLCSISVITFA